MKRFLLSAMVVGAISSSAMADTQQVSVPPSTPRPTVGGGVSHPWRSPWTIAEVSPEVSAYALMGLAGIGAAAAVIWGRKK